MPAPRGPKLDHPKVDLGVTPEQWNIFKRRWNAFVVGSGIDPDTSSAQLLQCAGDILGDAVLKSDPDIVSKPTSNVMAAVKELAAVAVATGVTRAELKQEHDESFRSFVARVHGKAETCQYTTKCACTPLQTFTLQTALSEMCCWLKSLIWTYAGSSARIKDILDRPVNEVISLVESKEMARDAYLFPVLAFYH